MKKRIPLLFTLGICVVTCLLIRNDAQKNMTELESQSIRLNNEMSLIYNNMGIQFDSEDSNLDFAIRAVSLEGDTLTLGDIFSNEKPTVVFRYSNSYCLLCVEQEIENLNNLFEEENPNFNIIGLSDFKDTGKFRNFTRLKSIKFNSYDLVEELNIPLEQLNIPYIFSIQDSQPYTRVVFVPSKDMPENSSRYYQILKSKLSNP